MHYHFVVVLAQVKRNTDASTPCPLNKNPVLPPFSVFNYEGRLRPTTLEPRRKKPRICSKNASSTALAVLSETP